MNPRSILISISRSGLEVITTCSPHNFDTVKKLGASAAFDYKEPNVGAKIREYTKNKLYYAFDTIAEHSSPQICADALSSETSKQTPKYGAILSAKTSREDVQHSYTLGYTILGESFKIRGQEIPAKAEDFEYMNWFMEEVLQGLLDEGKVGPHKTEVKGGLDGVYQGTQDMVSDTGAQIPSRNFRVLCERLALHIFPLLYDLWRSTSTLPESLSILAENQELAFR
jgi:hypothetical protein